jgi:hypothetical protein
MGRERMERSLVWTRFEIDGKIASKTKMQQDTTASVEQNLASVSVRDIEVCPRGKKLKTEEWLQM